jgi:hypothetical protein
MGKGQGVTSIFPFVRKAHAMFGALRCSVIDAISVTCPWCFESSDLLVEADVHGEFVQDCEVCCHPWAVHVHRSADGELEVNVERAH